MDLPGDNATRYGSFFAGGHQADEDDAQQVLATGGTAKNLYVHLTGPPGTALELTDQWKFTVFRNGSPTSLTCTIAAAATTCNDTTNSQGFVAGDRISIEIDADNGPNGNEEGSWSVQYS